VPTDAGAATAPTVAARRRAGAGIHGDARWLAGLAILAASLWGLQWFGVPPVLLHALVIIMWAVAGSRRWGLALGIAVAAAGWVCLACIALTISPLVGVDARVAANAAMVLAAVACVWFAHRASPRAASSLRLSAVLAPATGAVAWIAGQVVGMRSGGGGLAWAMYRDSTMDLWVMRQIVEYRGIPSLGRQFIAQPPPHAMSVALTDPTATIATSPESASAFLVGHASHWTLALMLSAYLAGVVVFALGSGAAHTRSSRIVLTASSALASLAMVSYPAAGIPMDLGQTNVPMLLLLLLAAIAAALGGVGHRALLASSLAWAVAGVIVAAWALLASVPFVLAVLLTWRARRVASSRDAFFAWLLPGLAIFGWSMAVYGLPVIRALLIGGNDYGRALATTGTFENPGFWESYVNPYSFPLAGLLAASIVILSLATWTAGRWPSLISLSVVAALVAGTAVSILALGELPRQLPYFPAKHLYIATVLLVPITVGLLARGVASHSWRRVLAGMLGLAIVVVCANVARPAERDGVPAWALTPWFVATGEHFGSHTDVVSPFVENASSDVLRLPWRADPPYDTTVALMMSSVGPAIDEQLFAMSRGVLRRHRGEFTAEVACALADAETRPVVLITRDGGLAAEIEALCPQSGVVVEQLSAR
jgi:hypothetical protein